MIVSQMLNMERRFYCRFSWTTEYNLSINIPMQPNSRKLTTLYENSVIYSFKYYLSSFPVLFTSNNCNWKPPQPNSYPSRILFSNVILRLHKQNKPTTLKTNVFFTSSSSSSCSFSLTLMFFGIFYFIITSKWYKLQLSRYISTRKKIYCI